MTPFAWLVNYIVQLMVAAEGGSAYAQSIVEFYHRWFPSFYNAALAIYNALP